MTRQGERMIAENLETLCETGGANERRTPCTKRQGEQMSAKTLGTVRERRPGRGGEYKQAQKKWRRGRRKGRSGASTVINMDSCL
jgi:hypothetical protein